MVFDRGTVPGGGGCRYGAQQPGFTADPAAITAAGHLSVLLLVLDPRRPDPGHARLAHPGGGRAAGWPPPDPGSVPEPLFDFSAVPGLFWPGLSVGGHQRQRRQLA